MFNNIKLVTDQTLNDLSQQAKESLRKRKNLNLHDRFDDPCQRLFNALEPETYIRPHRHTTPPKPECFMAIRGRLIMVVFEDSGAVGKVLSFGENTGVTAIEVPGGVWHTIVSLEPGAVFFETKPGPYRPIDDKDFAPWAPEERDPQALEYLADLKVKINRHLE